MPHRFEQQDPSINFSLPKPVATPQHGQKADMSAKSVKMKEPRSFEPRPGH